MNHDLMRAIGEKRLIEFVYKAGASRIVEPHDYGIRAPSMGASILSRRTARAFGNVLRAAR